MEKKIRREDITITKGTIEVDCFVVNGVAHELHKDKRYDTIDHHITHEDCSVCGKEFKKSGTYQKKCNSCLNIQARQKWESLDLVEWDAETPLVIFGDDTYFFDEESISDYCLEQEILPKDLMLVVCKKSTFPHIELDFFTDEVHEDWEPTAAMVAKIKEFNEFLDSESTDTWFECNKRVILDFEVEGLAIEEGGQG